MQNNNQKSIVGAIIIVGVLIAGAILLKDSSAPITKNSEKTLSEQVGVDKKDFTQCMENTDLKALSEKTNADAEKAMKGIPANERGTPYSVIVGKNGSKSQIRGAYPKENIQKLIDEVNAGKVTDVYTGEITGYQEGDHILGNPDAQIIIIEYSDLECPYCKKFGEIMKEMVAESNGNIAWIYRHWIVHQNALSKAGASECVSKIKGNDAFWKYIDLVFALMNPPEVPISEQL
jgi:protein-disulfide isomerase